MSITLEQLERAARLGGTGALLPFVPKVAPDFPAVGASLPPPGNEGGDSWDRVEALLSGRAPEKETKPTPTKPAPAPAPAKATEAPTLAKADPNPGTQKDLYYMRLPAKARPCTPIYDGKKVVGHVLPEETDKAVIYREVLSEEGRARATAIVEAVEGGRCEVAPNKAKFFALSLTVRP